MMLLLCLCLVSAALAQYDSLDACQAAAYGGCVFLGGTGWDDVSPWPCAPKSCPFHIKPLPGDCKPGLRPWPTKGNTSAQPDNTILAAATVTTALLQSKYAVLVSPPSLGWTGFQLAGNDNQYWMVSDTGTLITTDASGENLVGISLQGSENGYAVSERWVVAAWPDGDVCRYTAVPNTNMPGWNTTKPVTASLPKPAEAKFWPYASDGDYVYAVLENATTGPLEVYRWQPPSTVGFIHFATVVGDKACRYPPAGDWDVVVEGVMMGILYYTSAGGGYPCVFNMSVPGSAKVMMQLDANAQETATFQMNTDGSVVYQTTQSIWYATYPKQQYRDLKYEIQFATTYELYPGNTQHYPTGGGYWWSNRTLVYQGNGGFWSYEFLAPGQPPYTVLPVILDYNDPYYAPCGQLPQGLPLGKSYTWRYPMVATNGTIFGVALESVDGAVGAQGHVWAIDSASTVRAAQCALCVDQGNGGHGTCAMATCWCDTGCKGSDCSICTGPQ